MKDHAWETSLKERVIKQVWHQQLIAGTSAVRPCAGFPRIHVRSFVGWSLTGVLSIPLLL